MWLSKCTRAYKNIIQLNVFTIFFYIFISEASKFHMCKFYRIASNFLQAIQIVHELFDCPSYVTGDERTHGFVEYLCVQGISKLN